MLFCVALLCISGSTPKTFEELELAMIQAIHDVPTIHYGFKMEMPQDEKGAKATMQLDMLQDGDRVKYTAGYPGRYTITWISDGKTGWTLVDPQKVYIEHINDPKDVFNPRDYLPLSKSKPGDFRCVLSSQAQCLFTFNPSLVLKSIETVHVAGQTLRKAVSAVYGHENKTHSLILTEWFLPDRWLLKRVSVDIHGDKLTLHRSGVATVIDFKPKISPKDLLLDPALIEGYTKQDPPPQGS